MRGAGDSFKMMSTLEMKIKTQTRTVMESSKVMRRTNLTKILNSQMKMTRMIPTMNMVQRMGLKTKASTGKKWRSVPMKRIEKQLSTGSSRTT